MGQHNRTHAPQQTAQSFDYLIGTDEQIGRHSDPKHLRGLKIDDQFDLRGLLDRQVGGLLAFENSAGVDADQTVRVRKTAP